MRFNLIVALDALRGIGIKNSLPWTLRGDMSRFKQITTLTPEVNYFKYYNAVVMGRNTWESIPAKFKPLNGRINIVLTSKSRSDVISGLDNTDLVYVANSWQNVFDIVANINQTGELKHTEDSENPDTTTEEVTTKSLDETPLAINDIYIIGGQSVYETAINHPYCDNVYITEVYHKYEADAHFPKLEETQNNFVLTNVSSFRSDFDKVSNQTVYYRYFNYQNKTYFMEGHQIDDSVVSNLDIIETALLATPQNQVLLQTLKRQLQMKGQYQNLEEENYLSFLRNIADNGITRGDRTGVGTVSLFGQMLKYNLRDTFPMITTKKIFLRGIFEELMMYLRGQTDNKVLQSKGIHIWDGNTSREFLDKQGLTHFEEGDMGATYGFNFRHYGAEYKGCSHDYKGQGFDQLAYVLDLLRNNPTSRRILINLWNPTTLNQVALPSCLSQYQFYVNTETKELNLQIYIRSSDVFLANNWNTCTGALLVHLICNLEDIDLVPGDLTVVSGDTHLYTNHLDAVRENLTRTPRPFPKLVLKEPKKQIEDYNWEDVKIIGYQPYPNIKVEMAV